MPVALPVLLSPGGGSVGRAGQGRGARDMNDHHEQWPLFQLQLNPLYPSLFQSVLYYARRLTCSLLHGERDQEELHEPGTTIQSSGHYPLYHPFILHYSDPFVTCIKRV